jgi:hypothetical protein
VGRSIHRATKNVSAAYMEAHGRIEQALIEAGLSER